MDHEKCIVAYVRVSTSEQEKHGYGIRIQRRDIRAFAQRQKLRVSRTYADRAESGAAEDRTELQRLLRDCERGRIATIIIPTIDRLSRDVRIAENLFWTFANFGIQVLIADMPNYDPKNRKDVLIRQIREAIAEENRKEIIDRLWKGRRERVRNGRPAGGMVPYGYRRRQKRFVPHPVESEIIKIIFSLHASGSSGTEIARDLNRRAFRRRNGKEWDRRQVLSIVQRKNRYERGAVRYGAVEATNDKLVLIRKDDAA
jgi:site-specific DNA recombinase